jgi:hypothetical protein
VAVDNGLYLTRHAGLSALLLFTGQLHTSVFVESDTKRVTFEFYSPDGECQAIAKNFFSREGAAVDNSRLLLEAGRLIKARMSIAVKSAEQRWTNPVLNLPNPEAECQKTI